MTSRLPSLIVAVTAGVGMLLASCATGSSDGPGNVPPRRGLTVSSEKLQEHQEDEDDGTEERTYAKDDFGVLYQYRGPCSGVGGETDEHGDRFIPRLPAQKRCAHAETIVLDPEQHEHEGVISPIHEEPTVADLYGKRTGRRPEDFEPKDGDGVLSCVDGVIEFTYCDEHDACGMQSDFTFGCLPKEDDHGTLTDCYIANYYYGKCTNDRFEGDEHGSIVLWCDGELLQYEDCSASGQHCADIGPDDWGQQRGVYCVPDDGSDDD